MRITLVIFLLLLNFSFLKAQYSVIQIDALSAISTSPKAFRLRLERNIGEKLSFTFSGEFGSYHQKNVTLEEELNGSTTYKELKVYEVTGLGTMGEFRYYPFRRYVHAPLGTFFGTHMRAKSVKENYDPNGFDITTFGFTIDAGLHAGYKLNSKQWTIEILLGLGLAYGRYVEPNIRHRIPISYIQDLNETLNSLRLELSFGYIFPKLKMRKKKRDYVIG